VLISNQLKLYFLSTEQKFCVETVLSIFETEYRKDLTQNEVCGSCQESNEKQIFSMIWEVEATLLLL
jgi:hypothetical protein